MLNKLSNVNISFKSGWNNPVESISHLDVRYTTPESRANTITILGSSRSSDNILDSMDLCSKMTKDLVVNGYNILTGCCDRGIMGAAYSAAMKNSTKDIHTGKPLQNLAIIMDPAWGDEDLVNCVTIGKATSEGDRILKFGKASDTFVVFPGRATTLQEAVSLIQQNDYAPKGEPLKKIVLVGKDFFDGLVQQYKKLFTSKLLKHSPDELFRVLNSKKQILREII